MAFRFITGKTAQLPGDYKPQGDAETSIGRVTLFLPFPPSVNHYWRHVGHKTLISRKGREYRELVDWRCQHFGEPMQGPLRVHIDATFPDNRRRDLDNLLKACLDALTFAEVYLDDSQIKELTIRHIGTEKPGFLRVLIQPTEVRDERE